jgi:hypothetical protein
MHEAWRGVAGKEPAFLVGPDYIEGDAGQADARLWGEAWDVAKAQGFATVPPQSQGTVKVQETKET